MARAADTFIFDGNTSGAYNDGRNFFKADGVTRWAQNMYPGYDGTAAANVNGDSVLLSKNAVNALVGGDYSAVGALAKFAITDQYKTAAGAALDIGSSATPLQVVMQSTGSCTVDAKYAGNVYLKGGGAGLYNVTVLSTKKTGTASTLYLDGTVNNLIVLSGLVNIKATCTVAGTLKTGYLISQSNDVNLTITAGATIPATIECDGGQVTNNVNTTNLNQTGGKWINTAGDITNPTVRGGTFQWDGGTLTTIVASNSGIVDGSLSDAVRSATDAYVEFGGTLKLNNNSQSISITNPIHMNGGSLEVSPGTRLAVSYGG
jgi:hypothetical protein